MDKRQILIIDDDPRNIFALSAVLRAKGFEVVACSAVDEALEKLQSPMPFDAVLIDMMMPFLDGYEAIPMIRAIAHRANLPIGAVTAQAMLGDREKCLEAGADAYISKPIDVDVLLEFLTRRK